ncbi:MAG: AAA family ATPase [Planctomycetes bacterium]|nr:AAA family ATPase [Planctomycetota bacterium]
MPVNPFDPQRPSPPESFAGRERIIRRTREFITAAGSARRGGALLLHGHRGSGKTSALRKIQALVRAETDAAILVELPLRTRSSESVLLRDAVEEIHRCCAEPGRGGSRRRAALKKISEVNLGVAGVGVRLTGPRSGDAVNPLTLWRSCLSAIADRPILCLCIDDSELLDKTGLGTLKTIAEAPGGIPILLAVAGGPELMKRLSESDSSPVARVFSGAVFDLEEFTVEETAEALAAPLRAAGVPGAWSPAAAQRIWELSHGYPYLVKCLAYAAYREGVELQSADVEAAVSEALAVASSWLDREVPHASDADLVAFGRIARTGKTALRSVEILRLGIQSPYIARLVRLGVLKRTARGHYDLRKAPVIAYYHLLRRKLFPEA